MSKSFKVSAPIGDLKDPKKAEEVIKKGEDAPASVAVTADYKTSGFFQFETQPKIGFHQVSAKGKVPGIPTAESEMVPVKLHKDVYDRVNNMIIPRNLVIAALVEYALETLDSKSEMLLIERTGH